MKFVMNKTTKVLIVIMSALVVLTFFGVSHYYRYDALSIDPRVVGANELYKGYNALAGSANYPQILILMDSMEGIYSKYPHYHESYELGIVYNNRAAAFLSMAILPQHTVETKDSLLNISEGNVLKSIELYNNWLLEWGSKNTIEIKESLKPYFCKEDSVFFGKNTGRFINKRAKEIKEAQKETFRRLSVSHTNIGMILRHRDDFDGAVKQYLKALEFWPDNLSAENNLNILLNKPLKKPNILRRIFPKERLKD